MLHLGTWLSGGSGSTSSMVGLVQPLVGSMIKKVISDLNNSMITVDIKD